MRILVLCPRFPMAGGKGDQLRPFAYLRRLGARHELTVVTPSPPPDDAARQALDALGARVEVVGASRPARVRGALGAALRGRPAQAGWSFPPSAQAAARALAPGHDVALCFTARSVLPLPIPIVLDHIDALSLNMRQRARGPEGPHLRAAAAVEAVLMARWERRLSPHVAAQVVISHVDADALPGEQVVLPHPFEGFVADDASPDGRDIDVLFTGTMTYPPNVEAAHFLARDIVPLLRQKVPGARIVVVGRQASRLDLPGVEIESDVPDMGAYVRRARVAISPLLSGTGQVTKVLEAAAGGAAVVATTWVGERFAFPLVLADGAEALAEATAALLLDEDRRRAHADVGLAAMRAADPDAVAARLEEVLERAATRRTPALQSHGRTPMH